ncbi:MAG TPA: SDR family oxidoreductase [Bordetella sp.]
MTQQQGSKGYALITGASSGIGAIYADRLARRGYDLILVARREDRLRELAGRITAGTGRAVETVAADLGERASLAKVEAILRDDARITLLVNNAGTASIQPLLAAEVDEMSDMIALNVDALTRLSYAAAPGFVRRGSGTLINIASVVAIAPEVLNGVYGASKAYVLAFSRSLRSELADKGVRVQVVLPGATATDIWANAGRRLEDMPKEILMSTDQMVDAALAGLDLGEFATIPALPELADWDKFEQARQVLMPNLSLAEPAARYRQGA